MYIKAEKVANGPQAHDDQLRPGDPAARGPTLMARRAHTNNISSLNSLNFLHKPQRVSRLKTNLYPDEEILKNTNLNKKLSSDSSSGASGDDEEAALAALCDDQLAFPPVYKKSGELVKSSLKRRSKSLPTSPFVGGGNKQLGSPRAAPRLTRSKSVHFDHNTPVKYFCEDESPIDVSTRTAEKSQEISYQHKPVKSLYDDDAEADAGDDHFLSMGIDRLSLQQRRPAPALRKSKRFGELVRDQRAAPGNGGAPHKSRSTPNMAAASRVVGLYNANFPILSSNNPKTLKLNVFVNLSRDKKVFLQDLTLCAHRGAAAERVIVGRVLVKNIFFDKRVAVTYTWDHWRSSHEVEAVYVSDGDGILPGTNMDLFSFRIDDLPAPAARVQLEFAVHYVVRCDRQRLEFWDNNDARNYRVDCTLDGFHDPFT